MPKQVYNIQQFHGGLNTSSDPRDVMENELTAVTDIMVDEIGKVRTMGSYVDHDAGTNSADIEPGYGLFQFSHDRLGAEWIRGVLTVDDLTPSVSDYWQINKTHINISQTSSSGNGEGIICNITTDGAGDPTFSIVTAGYNYVIDEVIVFTDPGSTPNTANIVVATINGGGVPETGDDYLAMADTDGAANIDIYSRVTGTWGTGVVGLGSTTGMKPCFYIVDGALRVSDGNFGSSNENRWYGYIDREFFKSCDGDTVKVNQWVVSSQKVDKPSTSSVFDEAFEDGGTTYDQEEPLVESITGTNWFLTEADLHTADITNVSKIVVVVHATREDLQDTDIVYTLQVGQSEDTTPTNTTFSTAGNETKSVDVNTDTSSGYSKTHTFTFSPTDLPCASSGGVGIRAYCDFTGTGGDVTHKEIHSVTVYKGSSGTGGSHPELAAHVCNFEITFGGSGGTLWDKDWNIGCSFIYDESQESLIQELADQDDSADFDLTAAGEAESPKIKLNLDISGWNERITGVNLYMREASATTEEQWFKQCSYNLIDGTGRQYPNGVDTDFIFTPTIDEYSCEISNDKLPLPNLINSFEVETGMSPDEESIISKYKTAVVVNRSVYIGGIEVQKEDSDPEVMGDAMIKSPVNRFDLFPLSRMIEVSVRDGDNIVKLEEFADRILQFKKNKMHIINVSQEIEFLEATFIHKGVSHPAATCKTDFGIAWVNRLGCYLYDGQKVINLLEKGGRQIIKESDWTTFTTNEPMIGYIPKKRQLIVVDDNTSTGDGSIFLYDMVTQSWAKGSAATLTSNDLTNFVIDWNGDLVHAHTAGTVLKWDDASDSSRDISLMTKDIDFGQPAIRKKVYRVYLTFRGDACNVDIHYGVDGLTPASTFFVTNADGTTTGSGSTAKCIAHDVGTDDWVKAELKPGASINNISSFRLKISADGSDAIASDFEINDISIVYRLKGIK